MMEPIHYPESKQLTRKQLAENLDFFHKSQESEEKYILSLMPHSMSKSVHSKMHNVQFFRCNTGDDAIFAITELPDSEGFSFVMRNVRITPLNHTSFINMPRWVAKLLVFCGLRLSGQ